MGEVGEIELTPKDTYLFMEVWAEKGRSNKKTHLIISKSGQRKVNSKRRANHNGQEGAWKEIEMRVRCKGIPNWELKQWQGETDE